ncbi:MAG: hypothetical protein GXO26_01190 [Crenarchaeota archaeon]|nr:hypothetical protein [Thermoproteota archaeon]
MGKVIGLIVTITCIIILLALAHYILTMKPVKMVLVQIYNNIDNTRLRMILKTLYMIILRITEPLYVVIKAVVDYLKNLI